MSCAKIKQPREGELLEEGNFDDSTPKTEGIGAAGSFSAENGIKIDLLSDIANSKCPAFDPTLHKDYREKKGMAKE